MRFQSILFLTLLFLYVNISFALNVAYFSMSADVKLKLGIVLFEAMRRYEAGMDFNGLVERYSLVAEGNAVKVRVFVVEPECCNKFFIKSPEKQQRVPYYELVGYVPFSKLNSLAANENVISVEAVLASEENPLLKYSHALLELYAAYSKEDRKAFEFAVSHYGLVLKDNKVKVVMLCRGAYQAPLSVEVLSSERTEFGLRKITAFIPVDEFLNIAKNRNVISIVEAPTKSISVTPAVSVPVPEKAEELSFRFGITEMFFYSLVFIFVGAALGYKFARVYRKYH